MIVLKVIAYSILIAVLGYFAVMSFIIANEESEYRKNHMEVLNGLFYFRLYNFGLYCAWLQMVEGE